jgi:ElaB/YqjD/DUF883 family membrane-anchored ribosome-binding protein
METPDETPEVIRHDAHTLAEDARGLLAATPAVADEKVTQARERLAATLERGRQTYARLQEKASQGARRGEEAARNHPYSTLAVALGVVALVACVLSRRD